MSATRICRCDRRLTTGAGNENGRSVSPKRSVKPSRPSYILDEQIGFILRQVWQRHATIFAREIGINLTPTQWAALAKLTETGPCSQNLLGRLTAMDVATIKGVIDRLTARGLTETSPDPEDGRRLLVSLTRAGQQLAEKAAPNARCDYPGNAGAARRQGARDADGAVEQAAVIAQIIWGKISRGPECLESGPRDQTSPWASGVMTEGLPPAVCQRFIGNAAWCA